MTFHRHLVVVGQQLQIHSLRILNQIHFLSLMRHHHSHFRYRQRLLVVEQRLVVVHQQRLVVVLQQRLLVVEHLMEHFVVAQLGQLVRPLVLELVRRRRVVQPLVHRENGACGRLCVV